MLIDGKKVACASCIKGHRATHCNHRDRPLVEIKKVGRPSTQCKKCRELRRVRQLHVKCNCNQDALRIQKGRVTDPQTAGKQQTSNDCAKTVSAVVV
ncbi:copper-fist-domain-containing protein [Hesseltinella vesiculosa]|uniref:Copper-fist-domain-containing protein n=1 Tax=Hesseltinella vesiculosa TaxID=101127 RepID=A0A1X2GVJ5_9FUNG|nr:copper-fist-domain-containing protein [Hesseltinella vesiculosa]